ncbi:MAG: aminotransferase class V-fold PLP-dependent enzyme [Gemmatimonadota bacterium]
MSPFGRGFDPAHPDIHPELRAAMIAAAGLEPKAAAVIIARASLRLRELFRTAEPVVIYPGSAAALREIGLRSAVENRSLALIGGPGGEALADQTEALGKEVLRVRVHPGRTVEPAQLLRFLAGPEVDSVTLVHGEVGAGTLAPLAQLAAVTRARKDLLLFVDAGASLGASPFETDQWGLDFVVVASEGPLGLPTGLAFAAASARLLARARGLTGRGTQLDFVTHHAAAARGQTLAPLTPALAAVLELQLQRMLDVEGLPARWTRHEAMRVMVQSWAVGKGLPLLAVEGRRAQALTVLKVGDQRPASAVAQALAEEGWYVGAGEGDLLRIGHAGDLQPDQLGDLLTVLERVLMGVSSR